MREKSTPEFPMPFQYALVVVASVENLGLLTGSMKGALHATMISPSRLPRTFHN
jgi:hypothetical protein